MKNQKKYSKLPKDYFAFEDIVLRTIQPEDIELVRKWRNSQMNVLRQNEVITKIKQKFYFAQNVWPDMKSKFPRQILLGILLDDQLVGYGGFVNVSWKDKKSEISFLLEPSYEKNKILKNKIFIQFLISISRISFDILKLNRIWTETYAYRTEHVKVLEKAGFKREGYLRHNVIINNAMVDSIVHGYLESDWSKSEK